ncbi:MAG TPA: ECF transporter S component [Firmicutes bacterium]|nr:ECF transporter S component [Candidatus Fermentithermobacillaceae bacterium]
MKHDEVRKLVIGSLLLALSLVIPLAMGGILGVVIGPFSATLASHVPTFIAMLYGPLVAAAVGTGSALGFFMRLGPVVGARAAMHIPVGIAGSLLLRRGVSFPVTLALMAPLHGLLESLVVLLFNFTLQDAGYLVGVGTLLHHTMDSIIAIACWRALFYRGIGTPEGTARV